MQVIIKCHWGSSALALTSSSNYSTLKTGRMHPSNNDTSVLGDEWTLSRIGAGGGNFGAWFVYVDGYIYTDLVNFDHGARPVFYLTNDVKITSDGDGSLENPFIIES